MGFPVNLTYFGAASEWLSDHGSIHPQLGAVRAKFSYNVAWSVLHVLWHRRTEIPKAGFQFLNNNPFD